MVFCSKGMKLYKLDDNLFITAYGGAQYTGDFRETMQRLLRHGVDADELEIGLTEMCKHGHNVAEYGMRGIFMFSRTIGPKLGEAA